MKLISKLTLRYILKNKMRTILTLLGIIISIAMLVSIGIIIESFRGQMIKDSISYTGEYDFVSADPTNKDIKDLAKLKDVKNTYKLKSDKLARSHYYDDTLDFDYYAALKIVEGEQEYFSDIMPKGFIVEGRKPSEEGEIIVPYELRYLVPGFEKIGNIVNLKLSDSLDDAKDGFTASGFTPKYFRQLNGEEITAYNDENQEVNFLDGDAKDDLNRLTDSFTSERNYKIVGYHNYTTYNENINNYSEGQDDGNYAAYTQVILSYADKISDNYLLFGQFSNYNNLDKNNDIIEADTNEITLNSYLVRIKSPAISEYYNFFAGFAITLMTIILVAVILFVYNIFTSNYVERLRDLGLLKITGFTNSQIFKMVIFDSLFYFLVSVPIGFLSAHFAMKVVLSIVNNLLSKAVFDQAIYFDVIYNKYIVIGIIALAFLVIFLSNIFSAIFVFRRSPIETLEGKTKLKEVNYKARDKKVATKLLGFEGFLAARNIDRNRKRFILTTLSVTMSIVLFVVISGLTEFTNNQLVGGMINNEKINAEITADADKEVMRKDLEDIKSVDIKYNRVFNTYKIAMISPEGNNESSYHDLVTHHLGLEIYDDEFFENNISKDYDAVYYADWIFNELGYTVDEEGYATLKFVPYEINENYMGKETSNIEEDPYYLFKDDEEFSLRVKVIKAGDPGFISYNSSENLVIKESAKDEILSKLNEKYLSQHNVVFGVERTRFSQQDVYELQTILKKYPSGYVNATETPVFTIIKIFIYGFIALIVSIGAINIINATYTNTLTRRRELALIQTVGLEKNRLKKTVLYENMISIMIAGVLSLIASSILVFILYGLTYENLRGSLARDLLGNFSIPFVSWAIATGIAAILIYIFVTLPYNRMMKDNITNVLK